AQAVRVPPETPAPCQHLGEYALHSMPRPRAAVDELRAALFLDPRSPAIQRDFVAATRALATAEQSRSAQSTPAAPTTPGSSVVPGARTPGATPARPATRPSTPSTGGTPPAK